VVGKPAGTVGEPSHSYCPRIGFGISAADFGIACARSTIVGRFVAAARS
jgi:hypothetical protein